MGEPLTPGQIEAARQEWATWHMTCIKESLRYVRQMWGDAGIWDKHIEEATKSLNRARREHSRHMLRQQQEATATQAPTSALPPDPAAPSHTGS